MVAVVELTRAARTGEGVYTTLRWGAGPPASWPLHVARLQRGAAALGLPSVQADALLSAVQGAVQSTALATAELRVRVNLLADDADPTGHLHRAPPQSRLQVEVAGPAPVWGEPAAARLALAGPVRDPRRALAGHKLIAVAEDLHWRRQAQAQGMDDALLTCHIPGQPQLASEATTAALLLLSPGGQWWTPAPSAAPVVSTTLQALQSTGMLITPRRITLRQLLATPWQGVWLLSAVAGARPVKQLGDLAVLPHSADLQERLQPLLCAPPRPALASALAQTTAPRP